MRSRSRKIIEIRHKDKLAGMKFLLLALIKEALRIQKIEVRKNDLNYQILRIN